MHMLPFRLLLAMVQAVHILALPGAVSFDLLPGHLGNTGFLR
jgi:hypothetical protein